MARTPLLAFCLAASSPLWAGPEAERFSAERAFSPPPLLRFKLKQDAPTAQPKTICSELDFAGVTWPSALTPEDRQAVQLALNISGSYEGSEAWANITDNFDNQGVSLGLLNQNLGQGSLQPLLIRLRDEHPATLTALLGQAHLAGLLAMLSQWQSQAAVLSSPGPLSPLDEPGILPQAATPNQASVAWAAANLYSNGAFDKVWKNELTALAASPEYVSLQIGAALGYHDLAKTYMTKVGVGELRAYLLLFDFNVQNGGIYPQDFTDYDAYLAAAPKATSTEKLEKLLALRLRHVRARFVEDVKSRKRAIITGSGKVHGEKRNLPVQYCYDGAWPF